jgi:hypothetical protein
MSRERKAADIWADLKSADVLESQAKQRQGQPLCVVEHVHGNVINLNVPAGTTVGAILEQFTTRAKGPTCGV